MKVIAINGSPKADGNTATMLKVMAEELGKENIDVEIIHVGKEKLHGCIACEHCSKNGDNFCIFQDDIVNSISIKMRAADGFILGAPAYYAGIPSTMKSFLDRLFYTSSKYFKYKVATIVSIARRTGGLDVQHQLTNFLNLAEVVMPPTHYWMAVHGKTKGEVLQDAEGVQTVRKNARAMAWLMKVIEAGQNIPLPKEDNERVLTHFIR